VGRKKQASTFQDLNEQAKKEQEGRAGGALGDMGDLGDLDKMFEGVDMAQMQDMWKQALSDPDTMQQLEALGDKFSDALDELSKMSPEQLQQQMQEAISMLTDGEMADTIISKKDEVLASLEKTGMVAPDELAKFKADPDYFELKMRESFDQMKGIFNDPKLMKAAAESMQNSQQMMQELSRAFTEGLDSDEKIEEARLEILKNPELSTNPMLQGMFQSEDFKEILNDPKRWKESVKEGQKAFTQGAKFSQGAGVGEL
jgi:hypothetical protein